jgi:hypothetical protein
MSEQKLSAGERLAIVTRYLCVAVFAVVIFGGGLGQKAPSLNPLPLNAAYAAGGISSAPGYLSLTMKNGNNNKFYLVDTNRQMILVYALNNDQLRLVSARCFDVDRKILDGTIKAPMAIEGSNGVTYSEAEQYLKSVTPILERK